MASNRMFHMHTAIYGHFDIIESGVMDELNVSVIFTFDFLSLQGI